MQKYKMLLLPLVLGLTLIFYSWFLSYPILIDSINDYAFNHLSIFFWLGLLITLGSMFTIAATSENSTLRWIMTVGIIATMYSVYYFFPSLPTSDANFNRGLHEYFANSRSLDIPTFRQSYFQWPSVFIMTYIATSVSGLALADFEFLMFGVIGFLLATTLYVYFSKAYKKGAFIAVIAFFLVSSSYLNYQFASYSIALCLLFLLFILDTEHPSSSVSLTMLFLFVVITMTHAFVPVFFIVFLLFNWIFYRKKQYGQLFFFAVSTYFLYQFTSGSFSFANNILRVLNKESELSIAVSIIPSTSPLDAIAQRFTGPTIIACAFVCLLGFLPLFFKRKLRYQDNAILFTGILYLGLGVILYMLGSRAIAIAFIPISLGASYLFESRFRPYLKSVFLVLLLLFAFIPMRLTFFREGVFFQTNESHEAANYVIENYNWTRYSRILADYRTTDYLANRMPGNADFTTYPDPLELEHFNMIFYTIGLGINMKEWYNYTLDEVLSNSTRNVFYDNGHSRVILKVQP